MHNLNNVLELCLARIERGELSVEECLALYPEMSADLRPLLTAANKLAAFKNLNVRPNFRAVNRGKLLDHMDAHPRRKSGWGSSMALRYATSFAALALAFVTAGTALAQQALPGDALYAWKLASERAWRNLQQDRVEADLILVDRRIIELDAVRGMANLELIGVNEYAGLLLELREAVFASPGQTELVNEILVAHKTYLSDFFTNSEAELPSPDDLFSPIPLPPENSGGDDASDSTLDIPLLVPPPIKKDDEQDGSDSNEGLLEDVIDELLGLP